MCAAISTRYIPSSGVVSLKSIFTFNFIDLSNERYYQIIVSSVIAPHPSPPQHYVY